MSDRIAGLIITYEPAEDELTNCVFPALSQSDGLLIVDNSVSEAGREHVIRVVAAANRQVAGPKIQLICNGENLGLSRALNVGIAWARAHGFDFGLLLDQDSVLGPGTVSALRHVLEVAGRDGLSPILCASNVEVAPSGLQQLMESLLYGGQGDSDAPHPTRVAMTSGLLIPTGPSSNALTFDERLFLDGADHDLSLRLRESGRTLLAVPLARVSHRHGTSASGPAAVLGLRYSDPDRVYYLTRDTLRVSIRHFWTDPPTCLLIAGVAIGRVCTLTLHWSAAKTQLHAAVDGIRDLVRGRGGSRPSH